MTVQNKRFFIIVVIVIVLLLIPLVAMQFTDEVNWTTTDFILAGSLLIGTGLVLEIIMRTIKNINFRLGLIVAVLIVVMLVWIELAVGIFGTPFGGN